MVPEDTAAGEGPFWKGQFMAVVVIPLAVVVAEVHEGSMFCMTDGLEKKFCGTHTLLPEMTGTPQYEESEESIAFTSPWKLPHEDPNCREVRKVLKKLTSTPARGSAQTKPAAELQALLLEQGIKNWSARAPVADSWINGKPLLGHCLMIREAVVKPSGKGRETEQPPAA